VPNGTEATVLVGAPLSRTVRELYRKLLCGEGGVVADDDDP
jgi:hypothetical protein